jgi:hypothetical protein
MKKVTAIFEKGELKEVIVDSSEDFFEMMRKRREK